MPGVVADPGEPPDHLGDPWQGPQVGVEPVAFLAGQQLALRTGSRYALLIIQASRRLDLHLAREAVGDSRARLASEEELADDFAGYELGALPPLAGLVDAEVYVDPEVLGHDSVAFAAGTQTESVRLRPGELFGGGQVTTVPLVRHPERGSEDPVGRRRAAQQDIAGPERASR